MKLSFFNKLLLPNRVSMSHALKLNRWPLIDYVKQREDDKKRKEQERQDKIKSLYLSLIHI